MKKFLLILIVFTMFLGLVGCNRDIPNDNLNIELKKDIGKNIGSYNIIVSASNPNYEIFLTNGIYIIKGDDPLTKKVPNIGDVITYNNGQLINLGEYGIRYQGTDPNNYVYFNCQADVEKTDQTCETWRIIGIVDDKVKLIRAEALDDKRAWND